MKKEQRKNILLLQIHIMHFSQTSNAWMFAMFKNVIYSQLLKILSPNRCYNSDNQKLSNFRKDLFYHNAISSIAVKLLYYRLVLIAQHKISVLATSVTSSNLRNQALLLTEGTKNKEYMRTNTTHKI